MCDIEVEISRPPAFLVILEAAVEVTTMQGDDGVGAADGPEHTGFFEAGTDDRLTAGFDYTRANEQMLASKLWG